MKCCVLSLYNIIYNYNDKCLPKTFIFYFCGGEVAADDESGCNLNIYFLLFFP